MEQAPSSSCFVQPEEHFEFSLPAAGGSKVNALSSFDLDSARLKSRIPRSEFAII